MRTYAEYWNRIQESAVLQVHDVSLGGVLYTALCFGRMYFDDMHADWRLDGLHATAERGLCAAENELSYRLGSIFMALGVRRVIVPPEVFSGVGNVPPSLEAELKIAIISLVRNPNPFEDIVVLEPGEACVFATSGHPIVTLCDRGRFVVVHARQEMADVHASSRRMYEQVCDTAVALVTGCASTDAEILRNINAHVLFGAHPAHATYPLTAVPCDRRVRRYLANFGKDRVIQASGDQILLHGRLSLPALVATQLCVRGVPIERVHVGYESYLPLSLETGVPLSWQGAGTSGCNLAFVVRHKTRC